MCTNMDGCTQIYMHVQLNAAQEQQLNWATTTKKQRAMNITTTTKI